MAQLTGRVVAIVANNFNTINFPSTTTINEMMINDDVIIFIVIYQSPNTTPHYHHLIILCFYHHLVLRCIMYASLFHCRLALEDCSTIDTRKNAAASAHLVCLAMQNTVERPLKIAVDDPRSLGEGAVWDPVLNKLLWIDINRGKIFVYDETDETNLHIDLRQRLFWYTENTFCRRKGICIVDIETVHRGGKNSNQKVP